MRTPFSRRGGVLSGWHPVDLLALVLNVLLERAGVSPGMVDDVVAGCGAQVGAQAGNIARRAALAAGWPDAVPGATVERQAASSAQAAHWAAQSVLAGAQDLVVAGGVDVMSAVPLGANLAVPSVGKPFGPRLTARYRDGGGFVPPGLAAEAVAREFGLARRDLDGYTLSSFERAKRASKSAAYLAHVPVDEGRRPPIGRDEALSRVGSARGVRALLPLFQADGVITAANMAAEADGAAAILVAAPERARELGLVPKARFVSFAVAGDDPARWPLAAVQATRKALGAVGLGLGDVERYEVSETSAVAVLAWSQATGADMAKVNPDGGSLATGAPVGATGAALFPPVVQALAAGEARSALVCVAGEGGVATACLLEAP